MTNWLGKRRMADLDGVSDDVNLAVGGWKIGGVAVTATAASLNSAGAGGVGVRVNSAGSTYTRGRLNLIEGGNVTISIADDSGSDEVDVTLSVPMVSLLKWGVD